MPFRVRGPIYTRFYTHLFTSHMQAALFPHFLTLKPLSNIPCISSHRHASFSHHLLVIETSSEICIKSVESVPNLSSMHLYLYDTGVSKTWVFTPIVSCTLGFGLCCRFPIKAHSSSSSCVRLGAYVPSDLEARLHARRQKHCECRQRRR